MRRSVLTRPFGGLGVAAVVAAGPPAALGVHYIQHVTMYWAYVNESLLTGLTGLTD